MGDTIRLRPWTPRPSPRHVLWLDEAERAQPIDPVPLTEDLSVDVAIVGGGFTGLWTAYHLKRLDPGIRACVIEADFCGSGASGRNGGFAVAWWTKVGPLTHALGVQDGVAIARLVGAGVDTLDEVFQARGTDIHLRRGGWLWTAASRAQMDAWAATLVACERAGLQPWQLIDRDEVERRTGSAAHLGGVIDPSGATIHPGFLTRALRADVISAGVPVHERSPVASIMTGGAPTVVLGNGRTVSASTVVLCLNAWMAHLSPLSRTTVVVSSDMIATQPIPDILDRIGWRGGEGISDSRLMLDYYIRTRSGRIAFGRGASTLARSARIGPEFDQRPDLRPMLGGALGRLIPAAADTPITHVWAGPVDRTVSGLPTFGPLAGDRRILVGIGYSGSGVVPSIAGGRMLASVALGVRDEWSEAAAALGRVRSRALPPEPLRYLGGRVVQRAVVSKERAEDAGRTPTRLSSLLARFVPGGVIERL